MTADFFFMTKPYASIETTEASNLLDGAVRAFRADPSGLVLQIREKAKGVKRGRYGNVRLTRSECLDLAAYLIKVGETLDLEG